MNELVVVLVVAAVVAVAVFGLIPQKVIVYPWDHALLYTDGRFQGVLPAGKHRLWGFGRKHEVHRLRAGPANHISAPVDALSADRFALRLSAWVVYEIKDPRAAFETDVNTRLTNHTRDALVTAAAGRPLETLLAERAELGASVAASLAAALPDCTVTSASITGLTLPPEIRRLVVEVERAKLEGLAALERARGEHAALRSLANAARLIKDNPELMNLRALQAVSDGGGTLVLGEGGLLPVAGRKR